VQRVKVTKPFEQNTEISYSFDSKRKFKHERERHWFNLDILKCNILNTKTRYRIHGLTTRVRRKHPQQNQKLRLPQNH